MELEACFVEKIQQLTEWQAIRHEELLKKQKQQRELLSKSQERKVQELQAVIHTGCLLSPKNHDNLIKSEYLQFNSSSKTSPVEEEKEESIPQLSAPQVSLRSSTKQLLEEQSPQRIQSDFDYSISPEYPTIKMFSKKPQQPSGMTQNVALDDLPLPSPSKDFKTLLEEQLKDSETQLDSNKKSQVKRQFLRKGQGTARFRLNGLNPSPKVQGKLPSITQNSGSSEKKMKNNINPPSNKLALAKPPVNKRQSGDVNSDSCHSDLDSSKLETKIFELLEEKAENSSFCSTSSAFVAFMQQSTPVKLKSLFNKLSSQHGVMSSSIDEDELSSGILNQSTPKTKQLPRKIVTKNDYLSTKWESSSCMADESDVRDRRNESVESMHVRFAEYNDYKTIGLTDTSMISNDFEGSQVIYQKKGVWSEESSDSESPQLLEQPLDMASQTGDRDFHNDTDESSDHREEEEEEDDDSIGTYYDQDSTLRDVRENIRKVYDDECVKKTDPNLEITNTPTQLRYKSNISTDINEIVFKSDLLKSRLFELENEIEIFRKENASLSLQRQKWHDERQRIQREFEQKEKKLAQQRLELEEKIQDERKRLAREKAAFENRMRDVKEKNLQTKQEREENQLLREKIEELTIEFSEKERRWRIGQGQQRSQIRVLQAENINMKQELEELRVAVKKSNVRVKKIIPTNTKAIHQINKLLDGKTSVVSNKKVAENIYDTNARLPANVNYDEMIHGNKEKIIVYESTKDYVEPDEKSGDDDTEEIEDVYNYSNDKMKKIMEDEKNCSDVEVLEERLMNQRQPPITDIFEGKSKQKTLGSIENLDRESPRGSYQQFVREMINPQNNVKERGPPITTTESHQKKLSSPVFENNPGIHTKFLQAQAQNNNNDDDDDDAIDPRFTLLRNRQKDSGILKIKPSSSGYSIDSSYSPRKEIKIPLPKPSDDMTPRPDPVQVSHLSYMQSPEQSTQKHIREVEHADGHIEYWYANGNLKKFYPDRNYTKIIYYNGDVRENTADGCVKYYYCATNTWHTTFPDGFELLEFSDGQQERRTKDGTVEVLFADGSVRLVQPDGVEKWSLVDGTIAETFPNGEKILSLSNGQREIHTKEHKRREYADGTVKYVYPDGTQETRYSNGRVRMKDKEGKLIMDCFETQR